MGSLSGPTVYPRRNCRVDNEQIRCLRHHAARERTSPADEIHARCAMVRRLGLGLPRLEPPSERGIRRDRRRAAPSTSRSWRSHGSAIAPGDRSPRKRVRWDSSTWRSMTRRAGAIARSWQTSAARPLWVSSSEQSPPSPALESRCNECSPTTALASSPDPLTSSASASVSDTHGPGLTGHAPTVRPSASSRPCCASGPTPCPSSAQPLGPSSWTSTSTSTIIIVPIPHSTASRPWLG